jgi:16S rRNA (uracil1498-N3)-methyltransferase
MSGLKRVYSEKTQNDDVIRLSEENRHYLHNVLRMKGGECFELLTPQSLYICKLIKADRKEGIAQVESERLINPPSYSLTACQCVLKREYMDSVIERYAELGATKIIPVISEYSIKVVPEKTKLRYRQIAISAALVGESEFVAEIAEARHIDELKADSGDNILFYGRGERCPPKVTASAVQFIIGAEGGFTPAEVQSLKERGFIAATPFPQILKAETAGAVFCGMLRALL